MLQAKWRRRAPIAALGLALAVALVSVAGVASAAPNTDLYDPDVRVSDSFYPCPLQTNSNNPPVVLDCYNASYQPLAFPVVDTNQTSCDATGSSTIHIDRPSGTGSVPTQTPPPWLTGTVHWDLTATIGPQTGPAMPEIQPFPDDGNRIGSFGFHTGTVDVSGTVRIDTNNDSNPDIVATVSSVPNAGNWGICRLFAQQPSGADPGGGTDPITGAFYVVNAGVLTYEVTSGPAGLLGEKNNAEAYFTNALATCCNATPPGPGNPPSYVAPATGQFRLQFGSTHPAEGTSGTASTPPGTNVTVSNFGGVGGEVGGVSVTFSNVTTAGATTVTLLTSMPDQPSGFQVGSPPAVYEISTTAGVTPPFTICLPYGSLPAGVTPRIKHFENGAWVDVPITSTTGLPTQTVCGQVNSLSPFAVGYFTYQLSGPFQPVDPQPTQNVMKAGRTVPVKFSLGGAYSLGIFASGYPASQAVSCAGGQATDDVESTTSNPSGLVYDSASGTYVYSWKTLSSWKGQCRTLILKFTDGQELRANFKFS